MFSVLYFLLQDILDLNSIYDFPEEAFYFPASLAAV